MPSPMKETMIPSLPQLAATQLQPPPSPGTHRALRKLQSAHNLGAKAANQPSLISQQRFQQQQQQQRGVSPTRKGRNVSVNRSPQRVRANSDAHLLQPMADLAPNGHPTLSRRSGVSDALGLDRLFRDGPPDGDWEGALGSLRHHVLSDGIKSDSDGMVRNTGKNTLISHDY